MLQKEEVEARRKVERKEEVEERVEAEAEAEEEETNMKKIRTNHKMNKRNKRNKGLNSINRDRIETTQIKMGLRIHKISNLQMISQLK